MESRGTAAGQTFRPHRYPMLQSIVDSDTDSNQTLSDMVGEQILIKIIKGEFPVGTPLNSTELAEVLGVSRTPLAKALAKLTEDGILIQPRKQPAVVSTAAVDWLQQTRKLRQLIEPEAAAMACEHFDLDVIDDLWALSREAKPSPDHDWLAAARYLDFALHLTIAEFCKNEPIRSAIRKCLSYRRLVYAVAEPPRQGLKRDYDEHVAILNAISNADAKNARELMAAHLEKSHSSASF